MWPNQQETADLVTFTKEILNGKPHFLCSVSYKTPYSVGKNLSEVLKSLEESSDIIFKWSLPVGCKLMS